MGFFELGSKARWLRGSGIPGAGATAGATIALFELGIRTRASFGFSSSSSSSFDRGGKMLPDLELGMSMICSFNFTSSYVASSSFVSELTTGTGGGLIGGAACF
jgi:hypothetical protein